MDNVVLALTKGTLALVGLILNAGVIYITVRASWLHTPCNILLAAYEFCLLIYGFDKLLDVRDIFMDDNNFSVAQCFFSSALFLATFVTSFVLMAAIAVDRLISVIWPLNYANLNRKFYFFSVSSTALSSSAAILGLAYKDSKFSSKRRVSCGITSTLRGNAKYLTYFSLACELLSVFIYALLWLLMRCNVVENMASTKRIFKSLLCILLVSLFGFTPNTSYYLFAPFLGIRNFWEPKNTLARIVFEATGHLALIGCSANALILFFFSWEYRRAFLRYLPWLRYIVGNRYSQQFPRLTLQRTRDAACLGPMPTVLPVAGPSGLNSPGGVLGPQVSPVETLQQQRQKFLFSRNIYSKR